ncbi:cytochrome P450 [Cyathus striatus]|nr:cytochrome P450 [Cyathus striatus]
MYRHFNATAVKDFRPHQVKAAHGLLKRLLRGPEDVVKELRQVSGEVILSVTYGIDIQSSNDPYIGMAETAIHPLHEAFTPEHFCKWRNLVDVMINVPFSATKEAMDKGTTKSSFVMKCLEDIIGKEGNNTEEDIKSVAGAMYQVALAACILALLDYPNVLKKAQQEIDSVVPPGNLPDFCDQDSLPYITAVIAPVGVPHTACSDDIYKGYRIPAGSILIPNNQGILHDEKVFPNPELFIPERFMPNDEVAESRLQVSWAMVAGEICPGRYMAFETVWITLVSIIAVYDISKPIDKNGNVIEPSHEFSSSVLPMPAPFKAVFKPRNKAAEALINSC